MKFIKIAKSPDNKEIYENWSNLLDENSKLATNNLEFDLRSCEWIVEKCKNSENYSQSLYASLCNNKFYKNEECVYSCSWRQAGGIVANLNEKGTYIDWYCSGIVGSNVSEGTVTEEVKDDLLKLGWTVKPHEQEENNENYN